MAKELSLDCGDAKAKQLRTAVAHQYVPLTQSLGRFIAW